MTPEEFQGKLQKIVASAESRNGVITKEEVEDQFADESLSREQMDLVFAFLQSKKIVIRGYQRTSGKENPQKVAQHSAERTEEKAAAPETVSETFGTEQERHYLDLYLDEIAAVRPLQETERTSLLEKLRGKDPAAKKRVTELMLGDVVNLARKMDNGEVPLPDLIQEANLQVVLATDMLDYRMVRSLQEVHDRLLEDARQGIETMLEEQRDVHTRDRRMVEKVEEMKEAIQTLKEKLGRKVYLDEVAEYLEISEDEAADILRLAGEEVQDEEGGKPS